MKKASDFLFYIGTENPASLRLESTLAQSLQQLLIALALTGCSLNFPGKSERQYHLVLGAAPTPRAVAVNMRKSELGLSITPGLLNTSSEARPDCPRSGSLERPGAINLAPDFLSVNVGDEFLFGLFLAEETSQSTMLELFCDYQ